MFALGNECHQPGGSSTTPGWNGKATTVPLAFRAAAPAICDPAGRRSHEISGEFVAPNNLCSGVSRLSP
jgi:hypothetical protein